jgi:chromosome segregation ATPase
MTKKGTAPVVKEEKAKTKRSRKSRVTLEVVKDPQTDIPVSMDLGEEEPQTVEIPSLTEISEQEYKIAELQLQLSRADENNADLLAQVKNKEQAYYDLRTTYNKLLEDYKIERNKSKQISKALEEAKARASEYKASWNAAKAARDQFASETATVKNELSKVKNELSDAKSDIDTFVTNWKKARMLAVTFGIAFVASLIVSIVIAFV